MLGPNAPLVATLSQSFANIGQGTTSGRLTHISPSRKTPTSAQRSLDLQAVRWALVSVLDS